MTLLDCYPDVPPERVVKAVNDLTHEILAEERARIINAMENDTVLSREYKSTFDRICAIVRNEL